MISSLPPFSRHTSADWVFDADALRRTLLALDYPQQIIEPLLLAAAETGATSAARDAFLAFRNDWLDVKRDALDDPDRSVWHALAVVSACPALFEEHRERGIPWQTTVDTLADLPRRVTDFFNTYGRWGFDAQKWMRNHMRGRLFQVGRLQYGMGKLFQPANVYRSGATCVALARPDLPCDAEGWPRGEENAQWRTTLERRGGLLHGHAIRANGSVERTRTAIPEDAPCVLDAESDMLHIHIPMGKKLDVEDCRESIRRAFAFFDTHFSETQWRGICCSSWLLDPAMREILPPDSGIVAFGKLFAPLPLPNVNGGGHFRWIFGSGVDLERARRMPRKNRLQQALLDYLDAGGTLRDGAGYILRDSFI